MSDPDRDWWVNSGERVQVIGKGVIRFHAVYWLALLLSAGQPLPSAIYVHEYLSANGTKLSKSAGDAAPLRARQPVRHRRGPLVAAA